jgi:hypothetical protein
MFDTINKDKVFFNYLSHGVEPKEELIDKKGQNKRNLNKNEENLPNIEEKQFERKKTGMSNLMRTTNNFGMQSSFSTNTGFFSSNFKIIKVQSKVTLHLTIFEKVLV